MYKALREFGVPPGPFSEDSLGSGLLRDVVSGPKVVVSALCLAGESSKGISALGAGPGHGQLFALASVTLRTDCSGGTSAP